MELELETFTLIRFSRRSGKVDTTLEGLGNAALRLWALQNTTKTKDTIIFNKATGEVVYYFEGTEGYPKMFDQGLGNIDDYCPGLLAEIHRQS